MSDWLFCVQKSLGPSFLCPRLLSQNESFICLLHCLSTIITARKQSLQRSWFHRCLSVCLPPPPPGKHTLPLGSHIPWVDTPVPSACSDTHPAQCMLGYGQQAGGTYPTGIHSCYCLDTSTLYHAFIFF